MAAETEELTLSNLKPAAMRKARKRVGRGMGSGKGRYSGRGVKGQKARSGSHKMRPGFEGGQMPLYMRLGKQPGATSKDAMPIGPHRTQTVPLNVRDLDARFEDDDEVTLEALVAKGLIKNTRTDVKILGSGDVKKRLRVTAHAFSRTAREKIEEAGGTATALREPRVVKRKKRKKRKAAPKEEEGTTVADETEIPGEDSAEDGAPAEAGADDGAASEEES